MSDTRTIIRTTSIGLTYGLTLAQAYAQSFNIDMDFVFGPPELGTGAPSASFGAAANQLGHWNKVRASAIANVPLSDLTGNLTSARILGPTGGSSGGQNIPINTGDYALLLNDARTVGVVGDALEFRIEGLLNGQYSVVTYAAPLATLPLPTSPWRTRVTYSQAIGLQSKVVTGPMPGNSFGEGITHSVHTVLVSENVLFVKLESLEQYNSFFNGMQLTYVPEPATLVTLSLGLLLGKRRFGRLDSSNSKSMIS